jgi:hypothetical protein
LNSLLAAGIATLVMDGLMGFASDIGACLGCFIAGFVVFCSCYLLSSIRTGQLKPHCDCECDFMLDDHFNPSSLGSITYKD